jgi:hypothetical protein
LAVLNKNGQQEIFMSPTPNHKSGILSAVVQWLSHPFNSQGSALNWVLFVGLLIVIIWFWQHTLLMIQGEV